MIAYKVDNGTVWCRYAFESDVLVHRTVQNAIHILSTYTHMVFPLIKGRERKQTMWFKNKCNRMGIESHLYAFACVLLNVSFSCKFYCIRFRRIDGICASLLYHSWICCFWDDDKSAVTCVHKHRLHSMLQSCHHFDFETLVCTVDSMKWFVCFCVYVSLLMLLWIVNEHAAQMDSAHWLNFPIGLLNASHFRRDHAIRAVSVSYSDFLMMTIATNN